MTKTKTLAVELPASCPMLCTFCRTPLHGEGNGSFLLKQVEEALVQGAVSELYITSNGEPGVSAHFEAIIQIAKQYGVKLSILCATPVSVHKDAQRVEVSLNRFTKKTAFAAIQKAKQLNIPYVVSMVDDGNLQEDPEQILCQTDATAVLVRALQKEGASSQAAGATRLITRTKPPGTFPVPCYRELAMFEADYDAINAKGEYVRYLGGDV